MTLTISHLTDAEVEDSVRLQHASFRSGGGISLVLAPTDEISPSELSSESARRRESLANNPHSHYLKVVDSEIEPEKGGKMIAVAHWDIFPEGPTDEQFEKLCTPYPAPFEEGSPWTRAWNDFFGYIARARRQYFPRAPVAFLNLLAVDPAHHRRGVGTMLVRWGVEKADELGLQGFLEGSRMGAPLYEKFGFRVVHKEHFDCRVYGVGLERDDDNVVMVRERKGGGKE